MLSPEGRATSPYTGTYNAAGEVGVIFLKHRYLLILNLLFFCLGGEKQTMLVRQLHYKTVAMNNISIARIGHVAK